MQFIRSVGEGMLTNSTQIDFHAPLGKMKPSVPKMPPRTPRRSPYGVPTTGGVEAVPRHTEIQDNLARKICRSLSIMRDESREPWIEAIEYGTITWHVAMDGKPGCVVTRWAVTGFPSVYLIDLQGTIAATQLRGAALREKVAELVEAVH